MRHGEPFPLWGVSARVGLPGPTSPRHLTPDGKPDPSSADPLTRTLPEQCGEDMLECASCGKATLLVATMIVVRSGDVDGVVRGATSVGVRTQ